MSQNNRGALPHGEENDPAGGFSAADVAEAFEVDLDRIERAIRGEFGYEPNAIISSHQTQALAEVVLAERPIAEREAALMRLGAFTPRSDVEWGLGDTHSGEESDRLAGSATKPEDELASNQSSFDPATQDSR
ncbi:MAG: hypothetical protein ACJ789_01895 [Thermomicrobiales bacterium]